MNVIRRLLADPRLRARLARALTGAGIYRGVDRLLARLAGGLVLAFHNLPAPRFVAQVHALAPARPVSLDELLARHGRGESTAGLFAITFDDGVGETVRTVAAAARAEGWPVTFFIPTGYVENPDGMPFQWLRAVRPHLRAEVFTLSSRTLDLRAPGAIAAFVRATTRLMHTARREAYEPLVRELAEHLITTGRVARERLAPPLSISWEEMASLAREPLLRFESHGVSHTAVSALDAATLADELRASALAIRERTGVPCNHFCYPYGSRLSIGVTAPAVVACHYASAVTMERGRLARHDRYRLPRIPLYPGDEGAVARLKVLTT